MNAVEFVKKFGWESVIEFLADAPESATVISGLTCQFFKQYKDSPVWSRVFHRSGLECSVTRFSPIIHPIDVNDLKRLVESWELVESYGSINQAKQAIIDGNNHCMFIDLEQAIADVESVGGGV